MGSFVLGRALTPLGAAAAVLLLGGSLWAQVPGAPPPAPAPAATAPAPPPPAAPAPAAAPPPLAPAPAAPPPGASEPPPLEPPAAAPAAKPPSFLKTREEVEDARRDRRSRASERGPVLRDERYERNRLSRNFVLKQTPWVDFSLTNFWLSERTSNFLNLGVQVGGYFFDTLRISARLVAPLDEAEDDHYESSVPSFGSSQSYDQAKSRSVSLLYGASFGVLLSNSKTFVFAPGLLVLRTDVNDYGNSVSLTLPFEWTTPRRLRVGFELDLGHAFGGTSRLSCKDFTSGTLQSCGERAVDREGGTAVLLAFYMGWALTK